MDESWFEHAPSLTIHDETFKVLPAEELLWCKLYVLQRDHCDWPDVFNLLYAAGPGLDWDRLLGRIGGDFLLLQSALLVLNWLCPNRAARLPEKIRARFQLPASPPVSIEEEKRRVRLIDSRAWFAAFLPADVPLEV